MQVKYNLQTSVFINVFAIASCLYYYTIKYQQIINNKALKKPKKFIFAAIWLVGVI